MGWLPAGALSSPSPADPRDWTCHVVAEAGVPTLVHAADIAEAVRLAVTGSFRGPINLAADPVVDPALLGELLHARPVRLPTAVVRAVLATAWRLHLVPASPDLFDAVLRLPIMDTRRARDELGWRPRFDATATVEEFLTGLSGGAGLDTPPLTPSPPGGRLGELAGGVGERA